jgi:hypothetical protein
MRLLRLVITRFSHDDFLLQITLDLLDNVGTNLGPVWAGLRLRPLHELNKGLSKIRSP